MEDKIEVGEYVKTKRGIGKILEIKTVQPKMYGKHDVVYLIDKSPHMYISDIEFIKHSKNIIDLIEVGDYVNGMLVTEISKNHKVINICFYNGLYANNLTLVEADIKSIVTKESCESLEYRIGDKIDEQSR